MVIYAGGKAKGPLEALCQDYLKRLKPYRVLLKEVEGKSWNQLVKKRDQWWIMLHETGDDLTSVSWGKRLEAHAQAGREVCFFIGEAEGIPGEVFAHKDEVWSMGRLTWPHLWARAMALEQIYRAQKARENHPYSFL